MADAVPVLIGTTDVDGGCTFLNRRWLEFTGRGVEDELGMGWTDNVHPTTSSAASPTSGRRPSGGSRSKTMVKEGMDAMGASAGSVAVLDPDGTTLEVARAAGYSEALLEAFGRMDLSADVPLAEATRIGAPVVCGDLDELARRYPHLGSHPAGGNRAAAAFPLAVDERVVGAIGLSFADRQPFDQAQMEFLSAVVAQCAQALDRAWSYSAEAAARQAAEETRARMALLADASSVLAGSMEYEATLPEVAHRAIPLLGECCVIDVFGDDRGRKWRRIAAVHVDPNARNKLMTIPPEAWAAADAVDEAETLRDLDLRSALVVPPQARDRTLGMLALGRRKAGAFSDADRRLSEALGARVAQAVDNALLYRAERVAHEGRDRRGEAALPARRDHHPGLPARARPAPRAAGPPGRRRHL